MELVTKKNAKYTDSANTKLIQEFLTQFSKPTVWTSNEVKSYLSKIRNVALLTYTLVIRKCPNIIIYNSTVNHCVNQSINHCRTQQMAIKLDHMWRYYQLRRESDSYNSKEVNFTFKDNENNQRMKWWENFIERTKKKTRTSFPSGCTWATPAFFCSLSLSPTVTKRTNKN